MAGGARFFGWNPNFCIFSKNSFLEFQRERILQIGSLSRGIRITPPSSAAKKHIKNIAEAAKIICSAKSAEAVKTLGVCSGMATLVVLGPFIIVTQHFISLFYFFKFIGSIRLFVHIRMIFSG